MPESMSAMDKALNVAVATLDQVRKEAAGQVARLKEIGRIVSVGQGVAEAEGLPGAFSEEEVTLPGAVPAMVFNLEPDKLGLVLLGEGEGVSAGGRISRTGRTAVAPVGEEIIGRVIDPTGRPLDDSGPLWAEDWLPVERPAPGVMDRAPVEKPLQTGLKVVDALVPVGLGQRELILGDRQTGKSAVAVDAIINQRDKEVLCFYCAIGQRGSAVAKVIELLRHHGAMDYTTVITANDDSPAGLKYLAPYAATTMAEYFRDKGQDALIVYDDLTRHARAYRELSLLLRRPPGREAFPGDIFYVHSRLLERSTRLREDAGGGSLTALPIIETQAQNMSAYIPTNLISITDGQIYLDPGLFRKGVMPAVDIGRSVSRVGGKAQLPAYRLTVGDLRLAHAQFEELESFARFGSRLDEESRQSLHRGRLIREMLKQPQYEPVPAPEQVFLLLAVSQGYLDEYGVEQISEIEQRLRERFAEYGREISRRIADGGELSDEDKSRLTRIIKEGLADIEFEENHGDDSVAEATD